MPKSEEVINSNAENIKTALELLMHDIGYAGIYNKLYLDLEEYRSKYPVAFNESNTFWYLTFESLKESVMLRLCRICDTEKNSISFINLLYALKGCGEYFNKDEFKIRLKDNPFVDSLAEYDCQIDLNIIENQIVEFNSNKTVKKIILWRNNFVVHKGIKSGINRFQILETEKISFNEIKEFISYTRDTINLYLNKLIATTYSDQIVGFDDYRNMLRMTELGIKKIKDGIMLELEAFSKSKE